MANLMNNTSEINFNSQFINSDTSIPSEDGGETKKGLNLQINTNS